MLFNINKKSDVNTILSTIKGYVRQNADDDVIITETITIASEIIYNIVKFAQSGEFMIEHKDGSFVIVAKDDGKGFAQDAQNALSEGYSTANSLGLGLPSLFRMCDDIEISTSKSGTTITCIKENR